MASQAYIEAALGAELSAAAVATDATSLGSATVRCIFASTLTRDDAAEQLEQMRLEILNGRRAWPLAST